VEADLQVEAHQQVEENYTTSVQVMDPPLLVMGPVRMWKNFKLSDTTPLALPPLALHIRKMLKLLSRL
jgi:hypothetical protein